MALIFKKEEECFIWMKKKSYQPRNAESYEPIIIVWTQMQFVIHKWLFTTPCDCEFMFIYKRLLVKIRFTFNNTRKLQCWNSYGEDFQL